MNFHNPFSMNLLLHYLKTINLCDNYSYYFYYALFNESPIVQWLIFLAFRSNHALVILFSLPNCKYTALGSICNTESDKRHVWLLAAFDALFYFRNCELQR